MLIDFWIIGIPDYEPVFPAAMVGFTLGFVTGFLLMFFAIFRAGRCIRVAVCRLPMTYPSEPTNSSAVQT